jgi:hypothetical protein
LLSTDWTGPPFAVCHLIAMNLYGG